MNEEDNAAMHHYREDRQLIRFSNIYRGCKKYFIFHLLVILTVVYILYALGGLLPRFLIPRMPYLQINSDINALMFFDVNNDASKVTWSRATNSKEALETAIKSNVHMIEGDIILQGQGTSHQKLIPVMAQPPHFNSDLQLVDWLDRIKFLDKGIKLDITVIDALEISLQRIQELDSLFPLRFPVWIHADVLQGPHGGPVKVDPSRFFQTLKRVYPKCTVSLGWTTGTHTDLSQSGYTWNMVMDMYDLIHKWRIDDQPVIFQARLSLIRNSVPQLKWLCDNVAHSALNVLHVDGDNVLEEELMYVAYRFPPDEVFFDLNHKTHETMLAQYRHFSREKVNDFVSKRVDVVFKPQAWVEMGSYEEMESILSSSEALVLTSPMVYMVSKSKYRPTSEIFIMGRVQFLNRKNVAADAFATGISIFLRTTAFGSFDHIVGIKCFLGVEGNIEIKGSGLSEKIPGFRETAKVTPGTSNCFRFHITDTGHQVIFQVTSVHDCHTLESVVPNEKEHAVVLTADIPPKLTHDQNPLVVQLEDDKRQAVIDELSIKHKM